VLINLPGTCVPDPRTKIGMIITKSQGDEIPGKVDPIPRGHVENQHAPDFTLSQGIVKETDLIYGNSIIFHEVFVDYPRETRWVGD
jgi:hypothetical protein